MEIEALRKTFFRSSPTSSLSPDPQSVVIGQGVMRSREAPESG